MNALGHSPPLIRGTLIGSGFVLSIYQTHVNTFLDFTIIGDGSNDSYKNGEVENLANELNKKGRSAVVQCGRKLYLPR